MPACLCIDEVGLSLCIDLVSVADSKGRAAFFATEFVVQNPDKSALVRRLREAIDTQVKDKTCMCVHD
jgi:hypothetical protein